MTTSYNNFKIAKWKKWRKLSNWPIIDYRLWHVIQMCCSSVEWPWIGITDDQKKITTIFCLDFLNIRRFELRIGWLNWRSVRYRAILCMSRTTSKSVQKEWQILPASLIWIGLVCISRWNKVRNSNNRCLEKRKISNRGLRSCRSCSSSKLPVVDSRVSFLGSAEHASKASCCLCFRLEETRGNVWHLRWSIKYGLK